MIKVFVIIAKEPDSTNRFIDVKDNRPDAEQVVKDHKEDANYIDVDNEYLILEKEV